MVKQPKLGRILQLKQKENLPKPRKLKAKIEVNILLVSFKSINAFPSNYKKASNILNSNK